MTRGTRAANEQTIIDLTKLGSERVESTRKRDRLIDATRDLIYIHASLSFDIARISCYKQITGSSNSLQPNQHSIVVKLR